MERKISGLADETGFKIYDASGIEVRTKGYKVSRLRKWISEFFSFVRTFIPALVCLGGSPAGMAYILYILNIGSELPLGIQALLMVTSLFVGVLMLIGTFAVVAFIEQKIGKRAWIRLKEKHPEKWRNLAEYHACEHKLIYLLRENIEVNLDNLQEAPSLTIYCGTGKNQKLVLAEPSIEKLTEAIEVAREYLQKVSEQSKSP